MGLEANHTINDLGANSLEPFRPVDVGFFVESCLQFHQCRHFLAASHGLAQQVDQHRVGAGAVDRLLDGNHLRVLDRLAQQFKHRIEAFERQMHQHVTLLQALEHGRFALKSDRIRAMERGEHQFGPVDEIDQHAHARQVDRAAHAVQRLGQQFELVAQQRGHFIGAIR